MGLRLALFSISLRVKAPFVLEKAVNQLVRPFPFENTL